MPRATEMPGVQPGERPQTIAAIEILLRVMRQAVDCFPGDDIETILVFLTVAAASSGAHLRNPDLIRALDDNPLPDPLHRIISRRAVAAATGLPRETVRRRLDTLVAQGRLAGNARGVRTISDALSRDHNLAFARALIRELDGAHAKLAKFAA